MKNAKYSCNYIKIQKKGFTSANIATLKKSKIIPKKHNLYIP
jgi:hypothetical protein